ncbi:MAG TPA: TonB-dependent siderophore receptor [Steroidobacteraceae bacterium]
MSHVRKPPGTPAGIRSNRRATRHRRGSDTPISGPDRSSASRVVLALAALNVPALAFSQTAATEGPSADRLHQVVVSAKRMNDNGANNLALDKLTQPLLDTPQSISSMSSADLADQGVTDLGEALRTAPGITLGAGETSFQGDNPYLRGFPTKDDMYVDGERDFGYYYRDPFDDERVELLQGPSSILFGQGSTGGVINQVSKSPTLEPLLAGTAAVGTDDLQRATLDLDTPLPVGAGAAFRMNLMGDHYGVADRDDVHGDRWGAAPSLALGLGTPTRFEVSYFHQTSHDIPDLGIPWFHGSPAQVRRSNFYGFTSDYLDTDVNIVTARIEHDLSDSMTLSSQLRYSSDNREFRETEASIPKGTPADTPVADITVARNAVPSLQGNGTSTLLDDQTDLITRISTGAVTHAIVTGFELTREKSSATFFNDVGVPSTGLAYPTMPPYSVAEVYPALSDSTDVKTAGVFALDTLQWGNWQVMAAGREDLFDAPYSSAHYSAAGLVTSQTSNDQVNRIFSYRGAVVYKPAPNGSIYALTGTSFDPSAEGVISLISSGRGLAQANLNTDPEKTHTYELGSKWQLADDRLLMTGALFRTEKFNARVPNPDDAAFNIVGGDERVDGAQVEAKGYITPALDIDASYTYLASEVMRTTTGGPLLGAPLTNTPRNASSLQLEYQIAQPLQIGFGALQASSQLGQDTAASYEVAPGYVIWNAMAKYTFSPKIVVQLDLDNLTDRNYIEEVHPFHVVPGEGFVAMLSIRVRQ